MNRVRGRFAPSPSGEMHLGNAWTALLAWLHVRSLDGEMVLRMEDLDPSRCRTKYALQIIEDLKWLGLDWDEGPDKGGRFAPYNQDARRGLYKQYLDSLVGKGQVYPCYCSRAEILAAASAPHGEGERPYPGTCRSFSEQESDSLRRQGRKPALRLKAPSELLSFDDGLYGHIVQSISQACGDFIVQRSDGVHAYQLAVVVDDATMEISHVLRGEDLLSSTPRQLILYRLLSLKSPQYIHVPLLCSPDGHRLSKRQQDLSLAALRNAGVSAARIVGYLAWKAHLIPDWQPITACQLIGQFSLEVIPKQAVVVDGAIFQRGRK